MRQTVVKRAWERLYADNNHLQLLLGGPRSSAVDVSTLHPEPVKIFRLWQIYLDNVNPLFKITHTPTLQARIVEAAGIITNINPPMEALMFSIYCIAMQSLDVHDCQSIFGSSKEDLLRAYCFGCEQALLKCQYLRTGDRDCLTAYFLYLISVGPSTDPQSLSSMLGVAIRAAQRMGLHSEAALGKCAPLEAEMRRRLWWALVLFDTRISELAEHEPVVLTPTWDCQIPLNVNDSDLRPTMKEAPVVQGKSSEALFAVVRSELGEFVRNAAFYLDFTVPALKPIARGRGGVGGGLPALERTIEEKYLQYCDMENPVHCMTAWTARGYVARCRLVEYYSRQPRVPVPQPPQQQQPQQIDPERDAALSHAFAMLDCDTKIMASPLTQGYRWLLHFYFPFPAYIHIAQDLKTRPNAIGSEQADRAWEALSANYEARFAHTLTDDNPLFDIIAKTIFQAWEACEAPLRERAEQVPAPPRIVAHMRYKLDQAAKNRARKEGKEEQVEIEGSAGTVGSIGVMKAAMPTKFVGDGFLHGMGVQDSYAGAEPGVFPNLDVHQMNWGAMGWGFGPRMGW